MLQVRLLGQFDVRADGKRVIISSRAGQSLFAYLLLTAGTGQRRERLAGLLWPDTSDDKARHNLRTELWRIRKAIAGQPTSDLEYIHADELTVTFKPEADYWLDVAQLDRPISADSALNDLINHLTLYRGELLPGFYDDWIVLERERVQALFENKMKQLMEILIQERRWATALEWGERWIALGQTPEPAFRALMVAYAASGDRAKIIATFERCQAALERELGVEPSPETRTLYYQLLQGQAITNVDLSSTQILSVRRSQVTEPPAPGEPPFKGLQYFDETDADLFFGREQLTAKLVGHLRESQFLAVVVGASGSGKSSIVRAGMIPALRRGTSLANGTLPPNGSSRWRMHVITPTAHPLEALATTLTRDIESVTATATLIDDLAREPRSLSLYIKRAASVGPLSHILIVVDQFEELFTLCRDEFEREAFIDNLLTAIVPSSASTEGGLGRGDGLVTLVITIRADFYAYLAQYPELREAVARQQEYIGPMTADELHRAIEEPARRRGWEFEPGLVDLMLRDVSDEPGALPLLSHALLETWKRRSGRTLTLKGYADSGGVRGAIAYTAESVYQELSPEQQNITRDIFLRLTELGEGTEDTRRRATIGELTARPEQADQVRMVLTTLADARLITTDEDTAEVAHEALIREWPRLSEWLNEDREGLRLHRHLTEAAHEWELLERDPGALYRGARLAQAVEWAAIDPTALNLQERAFLDASGELEQREAIEREAQQQRELEAVQRLAETRRRANTQLHRRAVFLTAAFVLAMVLAGIALFFSERARGSANAAQTNARLASARELAAASLGNLDVDPERSILLALQAATTTYAIDKTVLPEAEDALHRAVLASHARLTLSGHTAQLVTVAYSPDGTRLATASQDGTAKVWDAATGKLLLTLREGHTDSVNGLAYSPDGKRIATASDDHTVQVFDAETGRELLTLAGHTGWVGSVAYSPDGARIVSSSKDDTVKMWDAMTGKELFTLPKGSHSDYIGNVAFSPDGKKFATASDDHTAKVWDAATGNELLKLVGHIDAINQVVFGPDGVRLATVSRDNTAKIWDATTGVQQLSLNLSGFGLGVAFSADGGHLATVGADGKAIVWDVTTGRQLLILSGHTSQVQGVAFSPDGARLATASWDNTAKVWDITPSRELLSFIAIDLAAPGFLVSSVAYSPDGTRLATANNDEARIWDAATGRLLFTLKGHTSYSDCVLFSPDGTRLVSTSDDGTAKVWDVFTGKELLTLRGHTAKVVSAAYSPNGTRLATASYDGTAKVWDAFTGKELLTLTGFVASGNLTGLSDIAFSPDGKLIAATGAPNRIIIWDATSGRELVRLTSPGNWPTAIAFSPDGQRMVTAFIDGTIKIFDVGSDPLQPKELFSLNGHRGAIPPWTVTFSPDGKRFATGSIDNTTKIWDTATGQNLLTLSGHEGGVFGVAFSPDGTRLATGGRDGTVRIYLLRIEDLVALARTRLTRTWTMGECQKFLHVEQCPTPP